MKIVKTNDVYRCTQKGGMRVPANNRGHDGKKVIVSLDCGRKREFYFISRERGQDILLSTTMLDPGSFETSSRVVEELPTERDLSKRLALLKKMNTNVQLRSLERMANKQRPCERFLQLSFGKDTNYEELPKISEVTEPTFEIEADTFRPNAMTDHEPATPSLAPGALEALNADVA